jgi:group II intron reverse transcriptase/maturase/CRISPR-associated endonuclease Cas1
MTKKYAASSQTPLLILGRFQDATHLAARRTLHTKARTQPLIVLDYQGGLSAVLTTRTKGNLHKTPTLWCDLANRRRPHAFRFKRSPGMKPAIRGFIQQLARHMVVPVSAATVEAVVDHAWHIADEGSIGIVALANSLRRPEVSHRLRHNPNVGPDLDHLIDLLAWVLRFPSVWALSEGNNLVNVERHLAMSGTIWFEMPSAHFEAIEHKIVAWMADAAITDALLSRQEDEAKSASKQLSPLVLYGFPGHCPQPFANGNIAAKHIGLFSFAAEHPLPAPAKHWLDADADVWVTGTMGDLSANAKTMWLTEDERLRLRKLESGQVWVRAGSTKTAVTALVRPPEPDTALAPQIRHQAFKRLRMATVKQFSTAFSSQLAPLPAHADLYRKLCNKDVLYAGWFRVKAHNPHSHGFDRITIEQFGTMVDTEIAALATELAEGRYRCRPLRTSRIPKPDGDFRILRVACVRDRVVQGACLHLIEPLFEPRMSPCSFAYRPGRSAHHAVAMARSAIRCGKHWAVIADIKKCFDSIDHDIVIRLLGAVIGDNDLLALIRHWLVSDIIDFGDIIPAELGIPQGEAISPLLANIYLDPLDKELEKSGFTFVRYADDYLVLCETEAETQAALRLMAEVLQGVLRLTLKPSKTHYTHVSKGVDFLGFRIGVSDVRIPPEKVEATVHSLEALIEVMASTSATPMERHNALIRLNARIMGVRNYFCIDDAAGVEVQLRHMDDAVSEIAGKKIAADSAIEQLWQSRELFVPMVEDIAGQMQTAAEVSLLTGAYPSGKAYRPTLASQANMALTEVRPIAANAAVQAIPIRDQALTPTASDADVVVVDGRLHVMTSGCYVTVSADDLVVKKRKKEIFRSPIADFCMAYLEGKGIAVSADLTMRLCENDVPVVFTPLIGAPGAIAQPVQSMRSNVRQQQVLRRNDPDIIRIGLDMLSAKVANQASLGKYYAKRQKRINESLYVALTGCADEIRAIADTLTGMDPAAVGVRASAMGHEGRAAARYWGAFAKLLPEDLAFPGRHTRHATDAVNSAINYVYGILYGEVWRAIVRAGLDPYFGIVHGTERDQGSLVFDVIEEYRAPFGDRVVLSLLGRGFQLVLDKDGRIKASCRHKLVVAFHKLWARPMRWRGKMRTPGEILEMQVTSLKNCFLGKGDYLAFHFRW